MPRKENQNFSLKRKLESSEVNPFRVENHVDTESVKNYVTKNTSFNAKVLQAQQAHERQRFFANFFAKEQEIHLELSPINFLL